MIHKAIIPAAGFGTRMLPAAKAVPKELLPILDRPTIQYVVEEAAAAGVDDVLLISSREKRAVEDHFDRSPELEARLREKGKESLLASINQLIAIVKIHSVRQMQQLGLGHAVYQARQHVGDEPCLCLLGDTIFSGEPSPSAQLVEAYRELKTTIIGVAEVPEQIVSRYGIVGGAVVREGVLRLNALVEKPAVDKAPSRLAIAARYVLTPAIFACIEKTRPGAGGEIQLTDALRLLLEREPIHAITLSAQRHDVGDPVDWLKTNLIYARRDPKIWEQVLSLTRSLLE
jgi:UTP--glucose-1-phosphate uridylyltransferase